MENRKLKLKEDGGDIAGTLARLHQIIEKCAHTVTVYVYESLTS